MFVEFPVMLLSIIYMANKGSSTRCWTCSSDHQPKCQDPFGPGGDNLQLRLQKCEVGVHHSYPNLVPPVAGCMKLKKRFIANGSIITIRNCTWKHPGDQSNQCPGLRLSYHEAQDFCQTCLYDGCNGVARVCETIALLLAVIALLIFK